MDVRTLPCPIFAFNFNDQIDLQGIVAAANKMQCSVILMLSARAIQFSGLTYLVNLLHTARAESAKPLFLELDHAKDVAVIRSALEIGFDLVMADFSSAKYDVNVTQTREVVQLAHAAGTLVEAELGQVPSLKPGMEVDNEFLTDPELVAQFVESTNVDLLAVSVGNSHGFSRQKPPLAYSLIRELAWKAKAPLVLHGADFYSESAISEAVDCGIAKINLGPELRVAYMEGLRRGIDTLDEECPDHRPALEMARCAVEHQVLSRLRGISAIPMLEPACCQSIMQGIA